MCKKLLFLISFVAVLGLVGSAFATDRHVGVGQRFDTIEAAFNAASAGDTIVIHADTAGGVKHYSPDQNTFKSATDAKHNITFKAASGTGTLDNIIIDNEGLTIKYHTGWTFDGLIFTNSNGGSYGLAGYYSANVHLDNITVKNCIFTQTNRSGFYFYGSTTDCFARNWTWENCTFLNIPGTGSSADGLRLARYYYDWTVKDCIFQDIKHWDGTKWSGEAISANNGSPVNADYCTFFNNATNCDGETNGFSSNDMAQYGTNVTLYNQVNFVTYNVDHPLFGYLKAENIAAVLTGDSDGSYRGARPTPEPATIALLGLGGLALLRRKH